MLPAPGRSARPVRDVAGDEVFVGETLLLVENVGMPDVGRAVITTSSDFPPLLLGLVSVAPNALTAPGEFSFRNEDGKRDRAGSLDGDPNLPLPPLDEGVDGMGEAGRDLSSNLLAVGGRRAEGGENGGDFACETSRALRSDSELRLFFLGGCVGMKLGCSPMVDRPKL